MAAKCMPHLVNDTQKQNQLSVCEDLTDQAKKDKNFLYKCFLFKKMKIWLKGQRFENAVGIQTETRALRDSITNWEFQRCFLQWEKCWDLCIISEGDNNTL
jgi:hypothetical protein